MREKRRISVVLIVCILLCFVLSPFSGTTIKAEETEEEKVEIINFNQAIVCNKQVDEFYFYNTSLTYDGSTATLRMEVINQGTETFTGRFFTIELMNRGHVMVEMHGYVGDAFEPGDKKMIGSMVAPGRDVVDADMMIISVGGREKNKLKRNLTPDVIGAKMLENRVSLYNIMVYGAHSKWMFRCDVIGMCDWLWNNEIEYVFRDEEGNELERLKGRLSKSFQKGELYEYVETTDVDLSQAASLEAHLVQRYSPEIIWEEKHFIDNTVSDDIKVEKISGIREENCASWRLTCRVTNKGNVTYWIDEAETNFRSDDTDPNMQFKNAVQQEIHPGETKDIVLIVERDIENTDYIEIALLAEVPVETPVPVESKEPEPMPTATPEETQTPVPTPTELPTGTGVPVLVPTPVPVESKEPEPMPTAAPEETQIPVPAPTKLPTGTGMPVSVPTPVAVESEEPEPMNEQGEKEVPSLQAEDVLRQLIVKGFRVRQKGDSVRVQWKKNRWAAGYQIFRSKSKNKGYQYLGEAKKKTYYIDKAVSPGKKYYYRIQAVSAGAYDAKKYGNMTECQGIKIRGDCAPAIEIRNKSYSSVLNYINIKLKRYHGTHIQVFYRKPGKKFQKVALKKNQITKERKQFRISYQKNLSRLHVKVRTYRLLNGKRRYSDFSKEITVINGK